MVCAACISQSLRTKLALRRKLDHSSYFCAHNRTATPQPVDQLTCTPEVVQDMTWHSLTALDSAICHACAPAVSALFISVNTSAESACARASECRCCMWAASVSAT